MRTIIQRTALICLMTSAIVTINNSHADDTPAAVHYQAAVAGVFPKIDDQVENGCWINTSSVLNAVKLVLAQSEITIVNYDSITKNFWDKINKDKIRQLPSLPSPLTLNIYALGYFGNGQCVASVAVSRDLPILLLDIDRYLNNQGDGYVMNFQDGAKYAFSSGTIHDAQAVMSGPKENFSNRLKEHFVAYTEQFAYRTILARQKLQQDHKTMFELATENQAYLRQFYGGD